jgi:predicted SAM-dependent methyltransferase
VNVGCGEFRAEGWVNVDMTRTDGGPQPDIVASATDLPFEDASVDRLYAGHVLEHLTPEDVVKAIREFARVVRADGKIMIVMPDLDVAEAKYPELVESVRYGADRWGGDKHLWESRPSTLAPLLVEAGHPDARLVPIHALVGSEWPVTAFVDWQYAFEI